MKKNCLSSFCLLLLLLISTNVVAQWIRQYPLPKLENVEDIVAGQDGNGFAVGPDDMVFRLNTSTQEWEQLPDAGKGWSLQAVDYLNGSNGNIVAVGGQGVLASLNGGQNWQEITGAPGGVHVIKLFSPTHAIVIADEGVFEFNNGTWADLNAPVSSGIINGHILSTTHIWCFDLGSNPNIYYTTDGGNQWFTNSDIERPDALKFYNANFGVAIDDRDVFHSNNGGISWNLISENEISNSVNDMSFGSSANVLMAVTNNSTNITQDTGRTWEELDLNIITERSHSVAAVSDTEWWVGSEVSSIAFSSNSGSTWEERAGPDRKLVNEMYMSDHMHGYAVGSSGLMLRTSNGGQLWEDITFDVTRNFNCVHGLSDNNVWAGQARGILQSLDRGDNWTQKLSLSSGSITDIYVASEQLIMATGGGGVIYRSADAGANWDTVYQTTGQLRSITRIDQNRFMATGYNGVIVRSENQGLTWSPLTAPEAGLQYEQTYFLGNDGWLITSSFEKTMWHTSNAGNNWTPITLPIERFWDGVFFMSPDTGIIVGRSTAEGRVYITFNGGQNWQAGYIKGFPFFGVSGIPNPNGIAWIHGFASDIEVLPYCNELPVIADFTGNTFPCENDTVTYSISAQDVDDFQWLFPTGWVIIGNGNNDTVQVKVGANAGIISVIGTNECGSANPINISAGPIRLPQIFSINGNTVPCEGEIITYSVTSQNVQDYTWTFPGLNWSIQGSSNSNEVNVIVGEEAGAIIVTGANSCGTADASLNVTPSLRPRAHGIVGDPDPCGNHINEYAADVEFESEVIWTLPLDWSFDSEPPFSSFILVHVGEESGTVTATAVNMCGESATASLAVTTLPAPAVEIIVMNETTLSLSVSGVVYQWFKDGELILGANGNQYLVTETGEYSASVEYANGCIVFSESVTIMITALDQTEAKSLLQLYPSPATEEIFIRSDLLIESYEILDMSGKVCQVGKVETQSISLQHLSPGVYIIKIKTDEVYRFERFVVQ